MEHKMEPKIKCGQLNCDKDADFLFTWPGRDQAGVCGEHSIKLVNIASAIGVHLQLIELGKIIT